MKNMDAIDRKSSAVSGTSFKRCDTRRIEWDTVAGCICSRGDAVVNASKSSLEIDALGLGEANAASPLQKPSAQAASLNGIPSNGLPIISSSDRIQRTARMLRSDSRVNLLT